MGTSLVYSCSNDYECGPRQLLRINVKQIVLRSPLQPGRISNYRIKTVEISNAKSVILMFYIRLIGATAAENL